MSDSVYIEELDLLKAKVLHLKLMVESQKVQLLQQQIQGYEEKKSALLKKIKRENELLAAKYDINLDTHIILEDTGEVVPKDSVPDIRKMMESLAQSQQAEKIGLPGVNATKG